MLIDLETFTLNEILEMMEDDKELIARIKESEDLLE